MTETSPSPDEIEAVRTFNRFHTKRIGVLEEGLLDSEFTLAEARILYELARREGVSASDLVRDLGMDAGYVSRILKRFKAAGLIEQRRSPADGRASVLTLTPRGRDAFAPLDTASREQVAAMLAPLASAERGELVDAMRRIERLLGATPPAPGAITIRPMKVGDIGWIAYRQGLLYHQEHGWDGSYEALVAEILAGFARTFDPSGEASWIAERNGRVVGSVFLVRKTDAIGKLRLLYVEPETRGSGLGAQLVDSCIAEARAKGYSKLTLWTNDILHAARRIYVARGFRLVAEAPHHSFGKDLVGQDWELDL